MAETTPEGAIPPTGSVPEVKKRGFSLKFWKREPKQEKVPDITPAAVQSTDFIPAAAAIESVTGPINATAPEGIADQNAPIDTIAKDVNADILSQMAATPTATTSPEVVIPIADQAPASLNDANKDTVMGNAAKINSILPGVPSPNFATSATNETPPPTETAPIPSITAGLESQIPSSVGMGLPTEEAA